MRLYGILPTDIKLAVANPVRRDVDSKGNSCLTGLGGGHRAIIVIVAGDDPDFVITTFPDD